MKTVFTWRQLLLLLILPSCVSCVGGFVEEDEETQENHSKLLGVWEPIYQYDYGWFQYQGSDIQTYSEAYPITEELVDEYNVYRFNSNTVSIIATSDPDIKDILESRVLIRWTRMCCLAVFSGVILSNTSILISMEMIS